MAAVVETIIRNENYSKDLFGTREHMVAQWIAHNLTYDIVTIENTPETVERIISTMSGSNTLEESSKKLDLRQIGNTLKRQDLISTHNLTSKRLAIIYEYIYTKYPYYLKENPYFKTESYQNFLLTSINNRKMLEEKIKNNSKGNLKYE